tara:strand:+ start:1070 stop:2179 length:1110 start_codon:yes stop_codon:yes gene_type:complete
MRWVLLLVALLISYGSLYPFNFHWHALSWREMLLPGSFHLTNLSDQVVNVLLFLPYGFLLGWERDSRHRNRIFGLVFGLLLAHTLQVLQIFLPTRIATTADTLFNWLGIGGGLMLGVVLGHPTWRTTTQRYVFATPLLLFLAWLIGRLFPFVPDFSWHNIESSIAPVLNTKHFHWKPFIIDSVSWLVAIYLLSEITKQRLDWVKAILFVCAVFFLEVLAAGNVITINNLIAAILAITLWTGVRHSRVEVTVAPLVMLSILALGILPFHWLGYAKAFHWLPFGMFLSGSSWANVVHILESCFLLGGAIYVIYRLGFSWFVSSCFVISSLVLLEILQLYLATHRPDISEPLLALVLALLFPKLDERSIRVG